MEPSYRYLDPERREIRLLQVKKRTTETGESLLTRTFTTSLLAPNHHPYKCLSYVWTDRTPVYDPKDVQQLEVRARDVKEGSSSPLEKLQQNALAALLQLAEEDSILTIWIDAICINQDDNDERSSQVAMMDDIYQKAEEVVAWLGPNKDTLGIEIIDGLARFGGDLFEEHWFQWCYRSEVPAEERRADQYYEGENGEKIPAWDKVIEAAKTRLPEWYEPDDENGRPTNEMTSFIFTGLSTFWTRAWIFQELAFARTARIQCGPASTTLANLLIAIKTWHGLKAAAEYAKVFGTGSVQSHWNPGEMATTEFSRNITNSLPLWNMLVAIVKVREDAGPAVPAEVLSLKLLILFAEFNATDPRDKVFALWGFVKEHGPNAWLLRPDYTLSIEAVFSRAAWYMIVTHRDLMVLTTHSHGRAAYQNFIDRTFGKTRADTELLDLPSWVPDWRQVLINTNAQQSHGWMHEDQKGKQPVFTDEEFKGLVQMSESKRILKVKGLQVGTITEIFGQDIFPYPLPTKDDNDEENDAAASHHERFANFVALATHGKDIICQYLRFVFRSSEGSTNKLLDYNVDLTTPIEVMKFQEDDSITVSEEAVFGSRIIKFLVRAMGEHSLLGNQSSDTQAVNPLDQITQGAKSLSIDNDITPSTSTDPHFSTWWPSLLATFGGLETWPPRMENGLKEAAYGAGLGEEGRQESMDEIQSWIGTKKFKFLLVQGVGLAVCPSCVHPEQGDVIWRFAASDGPIILRPIGAGCEMFRVVGECWVADNATRAMDFADWMSKADDLSWAEII